MIPSISRAPSPPAVETDTATHRAIAAAAHRFAQDTFSPAHVAAQTLAIYAALLRSNA